MSFKKLIRPLVSAGYACMDFIPFHYLLAYENVGNYSHCLPLLLHVLCMIMTFTAYRPNAWRVFVSCSRIIHQNFYTQTYSGNLFHRWFLNVKKDC